MASGYNLSKSPKDIKNVVIL